MKRVEEYLSIIDDPELASKLIVLLEELSQGSTLDKAARNSSLERRKVELLLSSAKEFLAERAAKSKNQDFVLQGSVKRVVAFCDGASRGNPGEAACAVVIYDVSGKEIIRKAQRIGKATNNVAEYKGVILALELAIATGTREVELKLDSELVVKQLRGEFKVKNLRLRELNRKALDLLKQFSSVSFEHISREKNHQADAIANAALDGEI